MTPWQFDALPDEEQAEMVGFETYEASLCPDCRQPFDKGMDPTNVFLVEDEVCHSCWAREYKQVEIRKAAGEKDAKLDPQAGLKLWVSGTKPHKHLREVPRGE